MTISETLLPEFDREMEATRRLLERVPTDKGTWKPHTKSFSLGHLTQLVCWMPGWITNTLKETELNLAGGAGYSYEKTEDLLEMFDRNVREARAAIASSKDADYEVDWSLKFGDRVVMTQPPSRGGADAHQPSDSPPGPAYCLSAIERCSTSIHIRAVRGRTPAGILVIAASRRVHGPGSSKPSYGSLDGRPISLLQLL